MVIIKDQRRSNSEPPEPERGLYGIQQVSVSSISWHNRIACAGVTSTGQLMLWQTLAIPGEGPVLPPFPFEAPETHLTKGRAFPWHMDCFRDHHKVGVALWLRVIIAIVLNRTNTPTPPLNSTALSSAPLAALRRGCFLPRADSSSLSSAP